MRHGWRLGIAVAMGLVVLLGPMPRAVAASLPSVVYTQYTCVSLWSAPSRASTFLSDVLGGTQMRVVGMNATGTWYQVLFLGTEKVWVEAPKVAATPPDIRGADDACPFPGVPIITRNPIATVHGPYPLSGSGTVTLATMLHAAPDPASRAVVAVAPGQRAFVTSWAGDGNGDIWYLAHAGGSLGWLWAYALQFDAPDPGIHTVHGVPVWQAVAGKGMWFTDYLPRHTDINVLVSAAVNSGITHLYPRVAESFYGFYDQNTLDRLLPVAHAHGIKVLAMVYPYLNDVATDLAMTQRVIAYRTPSGDAVDGIAADIEERTDPPAVYAYGQVLRQMVGPDYPLVATTYNPRGRPSYPYPEIAANFNVIAPQDYWHSDQTNPFTAQSARDLLALSVTTIIAQLGGRSFPIEELGQMYDMFSGNFTPGKNAPSADEIAGDFAAAKAFGCIGISFFEWNTASADELETFAKTNW